MHRPNALHRQIDDAEEYRSGSNRDEEECRTKPRNNREQRQHEVDEENRRADLRMNCSERLSGFSGHTARGMN